MASQIRLRRGTAAQWTSANPTLAEGEIGVETDTSKIKVGDGTTAWTSLAYQVAPSDIIDISTVEKGGIVVGTSSGNTTVLPVGANGTILGVDTGDPTTVGWVSPSFNSLSGTSITSPTTGNLLRFNGTNWVNVTDVQVLTDNRDMLTALVWGASAGYFSRGSSTTTVYKWTFPADTVTTTTAAPATMDTHDGFSNPAVAGYFSRGSGVTPGVVYKWAFSADIVTTTAAPPDFVNRHGGFSNASVAGYFNQGRISGSRTAVYKWSFPSDTSSTTTSSPTDMADNAGFANSSVAGYFSAGLSSTTVYKWAFPVDTVSTTNAAPASLNGSGSFANPAVAGYFSRGNSGTTVYKYAFPSDTVTTTTAASDYIKNSSAGFSNPTVSGYISRGGGESVVYKWTLPSDTSSTTTAAPDTMNEHGGFSNGY